MTLRSLAMAGLLLLCRMNLAADQQALEKQLAETLKKFEEALRSGDKDRQLKAFADLRPTEADLKTLADSKLVDKAQIEAGAKFFEKNIAKASEVFSSGATRLGEIESVSLTDLRAKTPPLKEMEALPKDVQVYNASIKRKNGRSGTGVFFLVNNHWLWNRVWFADEAMLKAK